MTYCVGMLLDEGLAMIADTRTNAGVDNIASYKKLHIVEVPGDRVIAMATSGNLSVTQTALALARSGLELPDTGQKATLESVTSLFQAAELLGRAIRLARREIAPSLQAEALKADANILVGGQIAGSGLELYQIYSQGNFIACGRETPYLQIGEFKYGKPILERALHVDTPLDEAMKLGLISFDSTLRSNISVGFPLDCITIPRDALRGVERRIESDDPYFRELSARWSAALKAAHEALPAPPWMSSAALKVVK